MKKIIKGKVYDTDTAEAVGEWSNHSRGFDRCRETLYRKRTGEFFLHGEGGARSKYGTCYENNLWGDGEKIIPVTYEAAQKWAEENLSGDEYEAIFGEISEDNSRTTITLSMSTASIERAKREAAKAGIPLSAYIEQQLGNNAKTYDVTLSNGNSIFDRMSGLRTVQEAVEWAMGRSGKYVMQIGITGDVSNPGIGISVDGEHLRYYNGIDWQDVTTAEIEKML